MSKTTKKIIHGTLRADVTDLATLANFFNKKGITFYSMNALYRKVIETLAYSVIQEDPLCKVTDEILATVILQDIKSQRKEKTYVKVEEQVQPGTEDYLDKLRKAEQLLKKETNNE